VSRTKLTLPVLSIGGEKANGDLLAHQMKLVASDVTFLVLKDTGHWLMEERPKGTMAALPQFL
jgi:pimeloyl-ACP methyl ester carboxylesterase